jgi:predicted transcriptional regulator of viral defense system
MAGKTKLSRNISYIVASLDAANKRVFAKADLQTLLKKHRNAGDLARHTKLADFVGFLSDQGQLRAVTLKSAHYQKEVTRYAWGDASRYQIAASIHKSGYLSHGTAAFLHGLLPVHPQTIHLNAEQSAKPHNQHQTLTQEGITRAFAGNQRHSKLTYSHGDLHVTILAGKNTRKIGVIELPDRELAGVPVTSLERTLIDIVVRPSYAGGVAGVLAAYSHVKNRVSIPKLVSILGEMKFTYPYAQSIGFVLQRAGFEPAQCDLLRPLVTQFNFYLDYSLVSPAFDKEWNLFYPREVT